MTSANAYTMNPEWRLLLADLGLRPADILRRAGMPRNLFGRQKVILNTEEYFHLWRAIEGEAADPTLPVRIGAAISVEAFDPPIFAALCSPNRSAPTKH